MFNFIWSDYHFGQMGSFHDENEPERPEENGGRLDTGTFNAPKNLSQATIDHLKKSEQLVKTKIFRIF